ncbi:MAG TPA: Pvc16 family protein [Anaerolineaceae bacterium]|nr:Pvc16 family protein [Anaerolineaceae bacterium]
MFNDIDDSLRDFLNNVIPISKAEIDISFDRPTRDWSGRLSRPTLNLFLFDIRERKELRDDVPVVSRNDNGQAIKQVPPRRIDLRYLVTVWIKEAEDEHRILARVLTCFFKYNNIDLKYMQGDLKSNPYPILCRLIPPDETINTVDLWSVLDNDYHTPLVWAVTTPLDVFKPMAGPLVVTKKIGVGVPKETWKESITQVGGKVFFKGNREKGIANVKIVIAGTGYEAVTDKEGQYSFSGAPEGHQLFKIKTADGVESEKEMQIPSNSYDIDL